MRVYEKCGDLPHFFYFINRRSMTPGYRDGAMIHPSLNEFIELSRNFSRVVVYREIAGDCITPISLLNSFSDAEHLFLLESANLDKSFSRYTFFGIRPRRIISFRNRALTV